MLVEKTKNLKRDFTATGYVINPERTKNLVSKRSHCERRPRHGVTGMKIDSNANLKLYSSLANW